MWFRELRDGPKCVLVICILPFDFPFPILSYLNNAYKNTGIQERSPKADYALLLLNDFKVPYGTLHIPSLWADGSTVYAQPQRRTSDPAGIRTQ